MSKIVQFQVVSRDQGKDIVYALTDEGKLWVHNPTLANGEHWEEIRAPFNDASDEQKRQSLMKNIDNE